MFVYVMSLFVFWTVMAISWAEKPSDVELSPQSMTVDITMIPLDVQEAYEKSRGLTLPERMKMVTEPMLGLPYLINGIGEQKAPDFDPIVRYDAFDCLTFVEEALALSLGNTPDEIHQIRKELRYGDGPITYENRNHFMISQWIPNAIEKGYLVDITHTLGETHVVSKTITKQTWSRWRGRHWFEFPVEHFPVGTYQIGVLGLDAAQAAIPKIPEGALILYVRQSNIHNPIWIAHLGFVVHHSEDNIRMRHATKMSKGIVKEHSLRWYFDHIRTYPRPIEGIMVLMPQEKSVVVDPSHLPIQPQVIPNPQ